MSPCSRCRTFRATPDWIQVGEIADCSLLQATCEPGALVSVREWQPQPVMMSAPELVGLGHGFFSACTFTKYSG